MILKKDAAHAGYFQLSRFFLLTKIDIRFQFSKFSFTDFVFEDKQKYQQDLSGWLRDVLKFRNVQLSLSRK